MDEQEHLYFVTNNGVKVPYQAVSTQKVNIARQRIEEQFKAEGKFPTLPTYEVTMVGGAVEKFPLTKDNLVVEGNPVETERRQKAWAAYQLQIDILTSAQGMAATELMIKRGILLKLPEDDSWIKDQIEDGLNPPLDDLGKLRYHYLMTEILVTPQDIASIVAKIVIASSKGAVSEEELTATMKSFLGPLQAEQAIRSDTFRGLSTGRTERGSLDIQPPTIGDKSSQSMESDPKPIPSPM